jgi:hypothetical protein
MDLLAIPESGSLPYEVEFTFPKISTFRKDVIITMKHYDPW